MDYKENIKTLAFAAKNGNEKCFEALYNEYYGKIYALCLATLKNNADAEDALQLTFISAWQNISSLEDPGAFNTWIQRIAVNQCYSILRKRKPDVSVEEEEETLDLNETEDELSLPGVYAERADLRERLKDIIDGLSDVQRQTVLLYYFNGLTVEEIAEVMNCGENTVKSRLMLARRSIKTEIEEKERKTGEKFFGVIGIPVLPFANLFVSQVRNSIIGKETATALFKGVFASLHHGTVATAAANATVSAGNAATEAVTATAAGNAAAVSSGAAAAGSAAVKGGAAAVGKGVFHGIAAKIIAAAVATGIVAGGAFGVATIVNNKKGNDATPASKTADIKSAYSAYADLLTENKAKIDDYFWQKGFYDEDGTPADSELARPVALCDFYGDSTPELIYVYQRQPMIAALRIVTYEDDSVRELFFEEDWDMNGAGGGMHTCLYRQKGDKTLYAYQSYGDMDWHIKYSAFEGGGTLRLEEKYYYMSDLAEDTNSLDEEFFVYTYKKDGTKTISEKEYNKAIADIHDKISEILIYTADCEDFVENFVKRSGCPAMTCDEAIEFLTGKTNTEPAKSEIAKYNFEREYEDDYEYGVVTALDASGKVVWKYETVKCRATELEQIVEIGVNGDHYYLVEGGKVICLDKITGETVWRAKEVGASNRFCFGKDGALYITGYYGPGATKIDKNGKVLWSSNYEDFYWPNGIEMIDENRLRISSEAVAAITVDAKTGEIIAPSAKEDEATLFKRVGGEYVFSSGAGGWGTDITLNADGTFEGEYHDSNYLDENTVEILCSKFHGRFSKVKKVNEYTYSAELAELTYDTQTGTEEISDHSDLLPGGKEIWRYTEAYGLEKCKTVYFYLKGAPMSSLPEEFIGWGYGAVGLTGEESTLPMNGFYNTEEEYGFFRWEDT